MSALWVGNDLILARSVARGGSRFRPFHRSAEQAATGAPGVLG